MRHDVVENPKHYTQSEIECIDYIEAMIRPYTGVVAGSLQNVLKYTWRAHDKNGQEDIQKARWYLKYAINEMRRQESEYITWRNPYLEQSILNSYSKEDNELLKKAFFQVKEGLPPSEKKKYEELYRAIRYDKLLTESSRRLAEDALRRWEMSFTGKKEKKQEVNHPSHYASGKIECIDYLRVMTSDYVGITAGCVQNALKYTWRCKLKKSNESNALKGLEDIRKAKWYLQHAAKYIDNQMQTYHETGKDCTFRLAYKRPYSKDDAALQNAAYQQVLQGLTPAEQECYTSLYDNLREGKFAMFNENRMDAIMALEKWERLYEQTKTIEVEQPKRSSRTRQK